MGYSNWNTSSLYVWFTRMNLKNGPISNVPLILHTLSYQEPHTLEKSPPLHSILETVSVRKLQYAILTKGSHYYLCDHVPKSKNLSKLYNIMLASTKGLDSEKFWPFPLLQMGNHFIVGTDCILEELEQRFVHPTLYPASKASYEVMCKKSAHYINHWTDQILQSVTNHYPLSYHMSTGANGSHDGMNELPVPHLLRIFKGYSSKYVHGTNRPHMSDFSLAALSWYLERSSPHLLNDLGKNVIPSKRRLKSIYQTCEDYIISERVDNDKDYLDEETCLDVVAKRYGVLGEEERLELEEDIGMRLIWKSKFEFLKDKNIDIFAHPGSACGVLCWINRTRTFSSANQTTVPPLLISSGKFIYMTRYGLTIEREVDGVKYLVTFPRKGLFIQLSISQNQSCITRQESENSTNTSSFRYLD